MDNLNKVSVILPSLDPDEKLMTVINKNDLAKVFDSKSAIYKSIVEADSFVQGYKTPSF